MRIATYILAGLGVLAWSTPIAIIIRISLGYERGLFGLLASIILSDAPPYARLATMSIGALFSLLAPIDRSPVPVLWRQSPCLAGGDNLAPQHPSRLPERDRVFLD